LEPSFEERVYRREGGYGERFEKANEDVKGRKLSAGHRAAIKAGIAKARKAQAKA
jgi:hypothetical protein